MMNDDFEEFRKTVDMNIEIQTQYLLSTCQERYRYPNPLDNLLSLNSSTVQGLMNGSVMCENRSVNYLILPLNFQRKFHYIMKWNHTR